MTHRVLMLNGPLPPPYGGIASLLDHLLPYLTRAGHVVHTLLPTGPGNAAGYASYERAGVGVHVGVAGRWPRLRGVLAAPGAWWGWWRRSGLPLRRFLRLLAPAAQWIGPADRLVREHRITCVHAWDSPWSQGWIGAYLKARHGCRLVLTTFGEVLPHHGELDHRDPSGAPLAPLVREVLGAADRIFSVSEHCAREVRQVEFPAERVQNIYGGVDLETFRPGAADPAITDRLWAAGPGPRILFLGQVRERKGPQVLVEAMARLRERQPGARAAIVGPDHGLAPALRERIATLGLGDTVRVCGPVPGDLVALYRACDIFVFPSLTEIECLGLSAIQAMACARPVVASRIGGVPEVVHDGETGCLVPPNDPAAMADALARLCGDPALRNRLGTAARADAEARFSRESFARQVLAVYDGLGDGPAAQP